MEGSRYIKFKLLQGDVPFPIIAGVITSTSNITIAPNSICILPAFSISLKYLRGSVQQIPNQCIARKSEASIQNRGILMELILKFKDQKQFQPKEHRRTLDCPIGLQTVIEELSSEKNPTQNNRIHDPTKIA